MFTTLDEIDTWENLKNRFKDWNFDSDHDNFENFEGIWKKQGRQICQYYTSQGNKIVYKDYMKMKAIKNNKNTLLIFCIDVSSKF